MAYDKERYDEIQAMAAGDLVHLMLLEFSKPQDMDDRIARGPYMQSTEYFWAYERLNEILPSQVDA